MSSQLQSAASCSLSHLEGCATEILERAAFFAVEKRLIGPPSNLLSLFTTSKTINFALLPENNNSLYAKDLCTQV